MGMQAALWYFPTWTGTVIPNYSSVHEEMTPPLSTQVQSICSGSRRMLL